MANLMPNRKVAVGALAGAVTVVLVWAVRQWGKVEIPPEVASAVTTIFTFGVSYMVPEPTTE